MFDIQNTTRTPHPTSIPYEEIKNAVLGKTYELSVVFCGTTLGRRINNQYRNKDYATNILSFPLSETSGEVFICQNVCRAQHKEHGRDYENFVAMLFVHGMVHLKGHDHGATMDKLEAQFRKRFSI